MYAKGSASFELRPPLLREGPHALPHVLALGDQRLRERLARGPTLALGLSKRLLQRAYESGLETCLEEEALAQTLVAQSEDLQEGMRAFAERRKPEFKGR